MEEQGKKQQASDKAAGIGCIAGLVGALCFLIGILLGMFTSSYASIVFAFIGAIGILACIVIAWFIPSDPETQKQVEDHNMRQKYNGLKYTCPMCGSHKVKTIGTGKKVAGVLAVGLASKNIGRCYQCDDCKYSW